MFTPKRPEATCLIFDRRSSVKRTGSSPPSPVFERPPMRFIATASVSCASRESEPSDIAPVEKRLTISAAGSTSSSGMPPSSRRAEAQQAAQRRASRRVGVDGGGELVVRLLAAAAHGVLQQRDRLGVPLMVLTVAPPGVEADNRAAGRRAVPGNARAWRTSAPSAISVRPIPPMRDGVPVKYRSTRLVERPTASKTCAPQ